MAKSIKTDKFLSKPIANNNNRHRIATNICKELPSGENSLENLSENLKKSTINKSNQMEKPINCQ